MKRASARVVATFIICTTLSMGTERALKFSLPLPPTAKLCIV